MIPQKIACNISTMKYFLFNEFVFMQKAQNEQIWRSTFLEIQVPKAL